MAAERKKIDPQALVRELADTTATPGRRRSITGPALEFVQAVLAHNDKTDGHRISIARVAKTLREKFGITVHPSALTKVAQQQLGRTSWQDA
jgi:hypothetical protein